MGDFTLLNKPLKLPLQASLNPLQNKDTTSLVP